MSNDLKSDQEIIEAIQAGGLVREQILYHISIQLDWKGLVINHVLNNSGNQQDGEDLAQNVFVILDRNIRGDIFKGESTLKTYFMSIVRRQWLNRLRDQKKTYELKNADYEKTGQNVEDQYINEEKKNYYEKLFSLVGKRCKEIFLLIRLDYSLREIAEKIGLSSPEMAKKESYRCRVKLRKFLEENQDWKKLIS